MVIALVFGGEDLVSSMVFIWYEEEDDEAAAMQRSSYAFAMKFAHTQLRAAPSSCLGEFAPAKILL